MHVVGELIVQDAKVVEARLGAVDFGIQALGVHQAVDGSHEIDPLGIGNMSPFYLVVLVLVVTCRVLDHDSCHRIGREKRKEGKSNEKGHVIPFLADSDILLRTALGLPIQASPGVVKGFAAQIAQDQARLDIFLAIPAAVRGGSSDRQASKAKKEKRPKLHDDDDRKAGRIPKSSRLLS